MESTFLGKIFYTSKVNTWSESRNNPNWSGSKPNDWFGSLDLSLMPKIYVLRSKSKYSDLRLESWVLESDSDLRA